MSLKKSLQEVSEDATTQSVTGAYEKWYDGPQSPEVVGDIAAIAKNYHALMMGPIILERLLQDHGVSADEIDRITWGARLMVVALVDMAEAAELPPID